jgi:D-alanyl-D-alanine carboxypeptidase/D-alanyl-D-alanine-endopeptidase (penicillin-binding protein 4)
MRGRIVGAVLAVVGLLGGYATADAVDVLPQDWPGVLTVEEPWVQPTPFPTPRIEALTSASELLPDLDPGAPVPDPARLASLAGPLLADPRIAPSVGVVVLDALTGDVLLDRAAQAPRLPASTLKLLTAAAALVSVGADARLLTRAVAGPDVATDAAAAGVATGTVYLVGGGDVVLAAGAGDGGAVVGRAGLGDLAAATAAALRVRGVTSVRVALDDTAVSGPSTASGWGPIDRQFVAPVSALAVDHGVLAGRPERDEDPALTAARTFAAALAAQGLSVEGDVARKAAPQEGVELAAVESATIAELVEHMLRTSDNDVAEALARRVAVTAGLPGDFASGSAAVLAALAADGLDVADVRMADASGLSEQDAVAPGTLARLLALTADPDRPYLLPLTAGLPVAGLDGTLDDRFDGSTDPAAGLLRAKTGTLLTAVSLAGLVLDADGRLLAFAVLADGVPVGSLSSARAAVDSWANSLAACGCS